MMSLANYKAVINYYLDMTKYCIYQLGLQEIDGIKSIYDLANYYRWLSLAFDNSLIFERELSGFLKTGRVIKEHDYLGALLEASDSFVEESEFIKKELSHSKVYCFHYLDMLTLDEALKLKKLLSANK